MPDKSLPSYLIIGGLGSAALIAVIILLHFHKKHPFKALGDSSNHGGNPMHRKTVLPVAEESNVRDPISQQRPLTPLSGYDEIRSFLAYEGYELKENLSEHNVYSGTVLKCGRNGTDVFIKVIGDYMDGITHGATENKINIIKCLQGLKESGQLSCTHLNLPKIIKAFSVADNMGRNSTYAVFESKLANIGDAYKYFNGNITERRKKLTAYMNGKLCPGNNAHRACNNIEDNAVIHHLDDEVDYDEIKSFAKQALEGINDLHKNHIYHLDLGFKNILVHKSDSGKVNYSITDFDDCQYTPDKDISRYAAIDIRNFGNILFSLWYNSLQMQDLSTDVPINLLNKSHPSEEDMLSIPKNEYRIHKFIYLKHGESLPPYMGTCSSYYSSNGRDNFTIRQIEKGSKVEKFLTFVKKLVAMRPLTAKQALEDSYFKEDAD